MKEDGERGNDTSIDLHIRITDLLIEAFMPKNADFDASTNNLVRRGVSSVTDDIMRMVEDAYGAAS